VINHPHVRRIVESIGRYRSQEIDVEELQANIAAVGMAMEGHLPKSLRQIVYDADNRLEEIRFAVNERDQHREVERVLHDLEGEVAALDEPIR
jgi:hypothetical protein